VLLATCFILGSPTSQNYYDAGESLNELRSAIVNIAGWRLSARIIGGS
jgi:hypothetical protein